MFMFYEECTLQEVLAYRDLENEYFDFGEGPMRAADGKYSEDEYYELRIQDELEQRQELSPQKTSKRKLVDKRKHNSYQRNKYTRMKLNKLHNNCNWWVISDMGSHKRRCYLREAKHARKISNKKVRKAKNITDGAHYKKVYDYWWHIL